MSLSPEYSEDLYKQTETGYLQFLQHFLQMQISFLQTISSSNTQGEPFERKYAEKQIIASLTLIEKMLMHIYFRDLLLERETNTSELKKDINKIDYLLMKLEYYLINQHFMHHITKKQCKKLLEMLSSYFYTGIQKVLIIDSSKPTVPWVQPFCSVNFIKESH